MLHHHPGERLHRRIVRHDHLHQRDPLDPRAPVPRRTGRRRRRACDHPPHHAAGDPLADQLRDDLPGALAAGELRVHLADHRRRPVLRHDRLRALCLSARVRERPVRLWRGAGARPGRHRHRASRWCSGASSTCGRCCRGRGSRCIDGCRRPDACRHRGQTGIGLAARARACGAVPRTSLLYVGPRARLAADPRALSVARHRRLLRPHRREHGRALAHAGDPAAGAARSGPCCGLSLDDAGAAAPARAGCLPASRLLALAVVTGPYLHLDNWRFLWNPQYRRHARRAAAGVGGHVSRASGPPSATR